MGFLSKLLRTNDLINRQTKIYPPDNIYDHSEMYNHLVRLFGKQDAKAIIDYWVLVYTIGKKNMLDEELSSQERSIAELSFIYCIGDLAMKEGLV